MAEIFDWLEPVPFWEPGGTEAGKALIRPALLEFASDTFMDDFLEAANTGRDADWRRLKQRVIPYRAASDAPEDETDAVNPLLTNVADPLKPLKLFHPAHQRFYLLCASLCCRQPGFPDRDVRKAERESVFYVLRKVDKAGVEYGWLVDGMAKSWQAVPGRGKSVLEKEERLPMFATGCQRQLQYGYVAVASRDTYKGTVPAVDSNPTEARLQRLAQFDENITRPFQQLLSPSLAVLPNLLPTGVREELSFNLLSDLADFIESYLPSLADAIRHSRALSATDPNIPLLQYLATNHLFDHGVASTWRDALRKVLRREAGLVFRIEIGDATPKTLRDQVAAVLPTPAATELKGTKQTKLPKLTADDSDLFQIRCVYERPCDAPFPPRRVVSQPTLPFKMASFFDSDAPARPIRIELPTDVGISAMRKFRKGVGFMMSNAMRNKASQATEGLLKDPPEPAAEGAWSLGMLCSFSIQIIFIVAFFLLLVFVIVFNLVFWWLPFFRICLPIPKKA